MENNKGNEELKKKGTNTGEECKELTCVKESKLPINVRVTLEIIKRNAFRVIVPMLIVVCIIAMLIVDLMPDSHYIGNVDPELARAMTYEQYEEGEEVVDGTEGCVEFSAFFLRDLDGDGDAEKIKGTCKEVGEEDILYLELAVLEEGELRDAVINIDAQNFYYNTTIAKDAKVKKTYISPNTKNIEFNTIKSGNHKLLLGEVRSGDYSQKLSKLDALGNDLSQYSKVNKVTLTGTYVKDEVETQITKEIELTIDWYGKIECKIPEYYKEKNVKNKRLYLGETKPEEIKVRFTVPVQETINKAILKKSYIEGTIPEINGYKPTNVKITGARVKYTYDRETGEYTAWREAEVSEEGKITSNAYSTIYVNEKYTEYNFEIEYPVDIYDTIEDEEAIDIPITAYYEGYNNPNEEFASICQSNTIEDNIHIALLTRDLDNPSVYMWIGDLKSKPEWRRVVEKDKPIDLYNGENVTEKDTYVELWKINTGADKDKKGIIIKDTRNLLGGENQEQKTNQFVYANNATEEMDDLVKYTGIYFNNAGYTVGIDGWIKIYNDETNELIKEFTYTEINAYNEKKIYYYPEGISHIRVETSGVTNQTTLNICNIKEIDDEKLVKRYTQEQFAKISKIKGQIVFYAEYNEGGTRYIDTATNEAIYEEKLSIATIKAIPEAITTQMTTESRIVIKAEKDKNNHEYGWKNGIFLVKFPSEIIDVKVNNIYISGTQAKIDSYEIYEQGENNYVKIYTSNTKEQDFEIILNCEISANPIMITTNANLELYAENEEGGYFYSGKDIYDINNNGNTNELVNHTTGKINLVSPNSLLTSTAVGEFDAKGTTVIAPKIAKVEKAQREAKVSINLANNYLGEVSDIEVIGKIPFIGNKYIINNNELGSKFNTTIQSSGIEIPVELRPYAKVYYSTNENPTRDITDKANGWATKEDVENWNNIKSYLVILDKFILAKDARHEISYKINIPEGLEYNDIAYCTHAVYFSLNTEEGKYRTNIESNKLGLMIAKQYDLELTKYQINQNQTVSGATYSITDVETGENRTAVTGENGKLLITGLYVEREYKIKEIKSPREYTLNEDEIVIGTEVDESNNVQVSVVSGTVRNINAIKEEGREWTVTLGVEDEPKARVEITKKEKDTGTVLSGVSFEITGEGKLGITITTDEQGQVTSKGLCLGEEYTLEETKANGYFLNAPIKFTINRDTETTISSPLNEQYEYQITEGAEAVTNSELVYDNGIPVLKLEIENEPRPTFKLEIVKVEKDQTTSLAGAKFEISGPGMDKPRKFTTDINGAIEIDKLYIGTSEEEAVEYTLTETEAPVGYIKTTPITFKVYNEGDSLTYEIISGQVKDPSIVEDVLSLIIEDDPVFKLVKKDGETAELLPNVKFVLYSIDPNTKEETFAKNTKGEELGELEVIKGEIYRVLITDDQGQITADLGDGLYKVVELETLEQYELPEDIEERSYYFGVGGTREGKVEAFNGWHTIIDNTMTFIEKIIQTSDEGYLVNGYFMTDKITLTDKNGNTIELKNNGTQNSFIIKYDKNRKIEWADSIGRTGTDYNYNKILETPDGYILAGTSNYLNGDITLSDKTELRGKGYYDIIIVKYKKDGTIKWSDIIGGTYPDELKAIATTKDGGILLGCHFNSLSKTSQKTGVEIAPSTTGSYNLLKYDIDGNIVLNWNLPFCPFGIQETEDNGYLVMGGFYNPITLQNGDTVTSKGSTDIIVVKYDNNGKLIWYDQIGGTGNDSYISNFTNEILKAKDGKYFVVGEFNSETITLSNGDKLYSGGNTTQNFIIKYNEFGKIEWSKQLKVGSRDIKATNDGGIARLDGVGNITKIDKNGKEEWTISPNNLSKTGTGAFSFYPYGLEEISDNKYVVAGCFSETMNLPSGEELTTTRST